MNTAPVVDFQPYDPAFAADPWPVYARLREHTPIFYSADLRMTLLTRYEDIRAVLLDSRFGRTLDHVTPRDEVDRRRRAANWDRLPNYSRYVRVNLLETEGADHSRVRKLVAAALSPRRIRELRERVQSVVNDLFDRIVPAGRMEFVSELAVPLPVHLISELLGWPEGERHRLRPWSADIVRLYEKDHTADDERRAETATTEFAAMLDALADERLAQPREDLISALVSIVDDGERLSRDELIATCMLLLNAGHEATVNAAGNGLLALLRHPAQLDRLRESPTLLTSAIEEVIRYDAPLHLFHRFALEDCEFHGVHFGKGDVAGLLYGCANRDPRAFERAGEFDIARNPNRHLGFGTGAHFCLGAPLARLELEVLFGTLLARLPGVRIEGAPPRHRPGLVFRGLESLRLRWD
jgi:cytochrome P450